MSEPNFDFVGTTRPNGPRGARVRAGKHEASIVAARYFASRDESKGNPLTCVIEVSVERTVLSAPLGELTPAELAAGKTSADTDDPHLSGEMVSSVWVNDGAAKQMFNGNVTGFVTAAKQSALNMLEAAMAVQPEEEWKDLKAAFEAGGIDCDFSKRNTPSPAEAKAFFGEGQPLAGIGLYIHGVRSKTKKGLIGTFSSFSPLAVDTWKKIMTEAG